MPGFPTEMPFPGGCPVPNACDSMRMSACPIEAGKPYTYKLGMEIGYTFPRVNTANFLFRTRLKILLSPKVPKIHQGLLRNSEELNGFQLLRS